MAVLATADGGAFPGQPEVRHAGLPARSSGGTSTSFGSPPPRQGVGGGGAQRASAGTRGRPGIPRRAGRGPVGQHRLAAGWAREPRRGPQPTQAAQPDVPRSGEPALPPGAPRGRPDGDQVGRPWSTRTADPLRRPARRRRPAPPGRRRARRTPVGRRPRGRAAGPRPLRVAWTGSRPGSASSTSRSASTTIGATMVRPRRRGVVVGGDLQGPVELPGRPRRLGPGVAGHLDGHVDEAVVDRSLPPGEERPHLAAEVGPVDDLLVSRSCAALLVCVMRDTSEISSTLS